MDQDITSVISCQECNNFQLCSFDSSKSIFVCSNPLAVFFFKYFKLKVYTMF